mmetsp:Transcript_44827/g.129662  ORF Transcript_44827/g.129662 Transcript_44827/m.129662 type:complete len:433 (-) Transcript_44827:71-1369(-)
MKVPAVVTLATFMQPVWSVRLSTPTTKPWTWTNPWMMQTKPATKERTRTECKPDSTRLEKAHTCKTGEGETCPMSAMKAGESTLVYPGGKTRCLDNSKPDYFFQVIPGSKNKLLIDFEGGGACWSKLSYDINTCGVKQARQWPRTGFFERSPRNPFSNYTILSIQYCSGDLHSGAVTHLWLDNMGRRVRQFGYHNTRSVIDWAKANFKGRLQSLIIMGQSAGAIGTQLWASSLLTDFSYASASVIADSYVGIFPDGFQGPVFKDLGVCGLDILEPELKERCMRKRITIADVFDHTIEKFPHVSFASINSKWEGVQASYFRKAGISMGRMFWDITPEDFLASVNKVLNRYNEHPNYVSLTVPFAHHTFMPCESLHNMTFAWKGGANSVADWVKQFTALPSGKKLQSVCVDEPEETVTLACSPALANKEFAVPR